MQTRQSWWCCRFVVAVGVLLLLYFVQNPGSNTDPKSRMTPQDGGGARTSSSPSLTAPPVDLLIGEAGTLTASHKGRDRPIQMSVLPPEPRNRFAESTKQPAFVQWEDEEKAKIKLIGRGSGKIRYQCCLQKVPFTKMTIPVQGSRIGQLELPRGQSRMKEAWLAKGQPCLCVKIVDKVTKHWNILLRIPTPQQIVAWQSIKFPRGQSTRLEKAADKKPPNIFYLMPDSVSWTDVSKKLNFTRSFLVEYRRRTEGGYGLPEAFYRKYPQHRPAPGGKQPSDRIAEFRDTQATGINSCGNQPQMLTGKYVERQAWPRWMHLFPQLSHEREANETQRSHFLKVAKDQGYSVTASFYALFQNAMAPEVTRYGFFNQSDLESYTDPDGSQSQCSDIVQWDYFKASNPGAESPSHAQFHEIEYADFLANKLLLQRQDNSIGPTLTWFSDQIGHTDHWVHMYQMDWHYARLLRRLEEAGVFEDTIVLWHADHGRDRPRNRHVTRNSYEKGQRMHAMNPVLAMLLPPSFSLGQSSSSLRRDYAAYLDSIGRRHIGEEQRELYKNILDNSWKEMRVTPFDTHAMMMDLVHGSTDGIKKVREDSPTVVTFGRSLAANQTEVAAKKATESGADFHRTLEETLRPPCHVMGVVDPACRYTESRDVTVDAFGDGSRNDALAAKVRELLSQHTRIREMDAYGNFSALPHCTLCVDYLTIPLENFNFTQMSLRSFEGTNRGLFVYNVALTVPHFNRSIGDRVLIWEGETGSFHSSYVVQPPESSQERQRMVQGLLESVTMLGIQRHSKYKPDQVFCGAKAWEEERFHNDHMHWCACAPPKENEAPPSSKALKS